MNATYHQDLTDCLAGEIGDGGLGQAEFDRYVTLSETAMEQLRGGLAAGTLPFLKLPAKKDDIQRIYDVAEMFSGTFQDVVILGTGGSSFGGQTLCSLANLESRPRVHFMDNVDPVTFDALIGSLDWATSGIIAISKSGFTAETLAQFGVLVSVLRQFVTAKNIPNHLAVVTEPGDNPLSLIARRLGCTILDHDPCVGGRYSGLSVTGLLPACIKGLDITAIRSGAATVIDLLTAGNAAADFPPAVGAATAVGLNRNKGISTSVLMPYCDRMSQFGFWYCQLWAESLGKQGEGITPIRAIGTADQHSQLQLYIDGPADKMFSLILTDTTGKGAKIPDEFSDAEGLSYLKDRTIGDLLTAAGRATADTLANHGRPTRLFNVTSVDESSLGALMMHFMIETVIAADLIGVNPYDQPAVEEGKILTHQYLSKRGVK
ncbi:MAG: glucose-6-phosphate isomerase [Pseudomonadota bacterium]|nr:glucose-6-phosphate isomerase [Pseudomonadota bacterium]